MEKRGGANGVKGGASSGVFRMIPLAAGVALASGCGSILDVHEGTYVASDGSVGCVASDCDAGEAQGGAADAAGKGGAPAGGREAPGGAGGKIAEGGDESSGGTEAGPGEGGSAEAGVSSGGTVGGGGTPASGGKSGTGGCSGSSCVVPPSCVGLPRTCGASQNDDCCASPKVTGGTFSRSDTPGADLATVSDFRLDKYEVTVGRFRKFMAAVEYAPAPASGKHAHLNGGSGLVNADATVTPPFEQGWQFSSWGGDRNLVERAVTEGNFADCAGATWTAAPGANETKPINCVSWFAAYAFCIWDGGFLPSEAEAKYAAAGGSDLRPYPSGSVLDAAHAVYCSSSPCPAGPLAVGSKPPGIGKFGQLDLVGNVLEWMLDSADDPGYAGSCNNCSYLPDDREPPDGLLIKMRRLMAGGYQSLQAGMQMNWASLQWQTPQNYFPDIGVRCARPPN